MKSEPEIRQALRDWLIKANKKIQPADLTDETPIIEQKIISSLRLMDLLIFIEHLRDKPVDVNGLGVGAFLNINTIYQTFFVEV